MRRSLSAALLALALVVVLTASAVAHAVLLSAEPADGSVLATVPPAVTLRFNEAVGIGALTLVDALGRKRDDVRFDAAEATVVVTLPSDLPRGSQLVSYRVISADGHPVAGAVTFAVGAPSTNAASVTRDRWRDGLIWLARLGLYVGLFFGVGGAFFVTWLGPVRSAHGIVFAALGVGLAAAGPSIGLQGLDLQDLPLASLATPEPWIAGAATTLMRTLLVAVVAMLAAIGAMR
ncbi:MAG: copper resistance CopC family protein, partial [Bradyrhizobium sp.]